MKTIKKTLQSAPAMLLLLFLCSFFTACSSDSKEEAEGDGLISILKKNKWILHESEFNVYSETELEYRTDGHYLYFISDTEGWDVTITKIVDTFAADLDNFNRDISKFEYNVSGNKVYMYYSGSGSMTLTYDDGVLSYSNLVYSPMALNSSDYDFLRSNGNQEGSSGSCTYSYDPQTNVLRISGRGDMKDYTATNQPWHDYVIKTIIVENGVTSIGNHAFYNVGQSNLQSVELPNSLGYIGTEAFAQQPLLTDIDIPASVEEIGEGAFSSCRRLSRVTFETNGQNNSSLKKIGRMAFSSCVISSNITIPNSVETIGNTAFSGSYSRVTIGSSVTTIENGAFNSTASSGKMYVNRGNPPSAYNTLTRDDSRWTLYVPTGCKSAYQRTSPWSGFKSIVEDSSLEKGDDYQPQGGGDSSGTLSCPDSRHPHAIDLGLPSGTKWACCNVGASAPDEYGDYFAWGETSPKSKYDWSTYKYCNGSVFTMTKYCIESDYGRVDDKTVLEKSDDAAYVNWGSSWRMPTIDEVEELRDNTKSEWTTKNGVKGRKLTGTNGGSIFFPAAGYRLVGSLSNVGSYGYYWSASLSTSFSSRGRYLYFYSGDVGTRNYYRGYGLSVRAVLRN